MRVLFIHSNFPAQFSRLAQTLAMDSKNQVVFITARKDGELPRVYKAVYTVARGASPNTHPYVIPFENAALHGQAVYRVAAALREQGFIPDIIIGHSGYGATLYMKDLFPNTPLLSYFEWFSKAHGSVADFDPAEPVTPDDECRFRSLNASILIDLYSCDKGISPTYYQRQQFPIEFQSKISVLHDGIDTQLVCPQLGRKLYLPHSNLDLSQVDELVTYVARGMESTRGFSQFMETVALLLKRRPKLHVVIVGQDRVAYGAPLSNGMTYKQMMLEKLSMDLSRVHFTGVLPYQEYIQVLQASSVHIYLTRPFVLSWSMLEAMSAGCLLVASATAPVQEIVEDGVNGLLVDFFSPVEIADRVEDALNNQEGMASIRQKARETILEKYDIRNILPQQIQFLKQMIGK